MPLSSFLTVRRAQWRACVAVTILVLSAVGRTALAQMPDLRQMAGQPLPSAELQTGSVSVRVVRQAISNNLAGVAVAVVNEPMGPGGPVARGTTDQGGRSVFQGLTVGGSYRVAAIVDGETLASQPFLVPPTGGLRILLVAGLGTSPPAAPEASQPAVPAAPGSITLGGQSRFVFELAEGSVEVFCLLDVINPASSAVTLPEPLVFDLPAAATNASALDGSTPLMRIEGSRAILSGPLPPGSTNLQFAYRLPTSSPQLSLQQRLPLGAPQGTVIVRKWGAVAVSLAGEQGRREVPIEGRTYIVLNTGPIASGSGIDVSLTGLPAQPRWPKVLALGLAVLVAIVGVWLSVTARPPLGDEATLLAAERAARFNALVDVQRQLARHATPELEASRAALIAEVAELDLALQVAEPGQRSIIAGGTGKRVGADVRPTAAQ